MSFDFDEWAQLYKTDPEAYEQRRKEEIEAVISKASPEQQKKLRQLQWKLDVIHYTRSPLAATVAMSSMMMESARSLQEQLNNLSEACGEAIAKQE